jgi:hypothetical protein
MRSLLSLPFLFFACKSDPFQPKELPGIYSVYAEQGGYESWNTGWREERELTLDPDSTFRMINANFSAFDLYDFGGKWHVSGDTLFLSCDYPLEYSAGKFVKHEPDELFPYHTDRLLITAGKLRILDGTLLSGMYMEKRATR